MALLGKELFVGGEPDSVRLVSGTWGVGTSSDYIDTAYSACALNLSGATYEALLYDSYMAPTSQETGENLWFHAMIVPYATAAQGVLAAFYSSSDAALFRLRLSNGYNIHFEVYTGSTWTSLFSANYSYEKITYDIKYNSGTKILELFVNQEIAYSGTHAGLTLGNVKYARFGSTGAAAYISQILMTQNRSTIGALVRTRKATAQGALAEMSGAYTNLVKTAVNDATAVISDTAGQKSSYVMQTSSTPANMEMGGLWLWTRGRKTAGGPQTLKALLRTSASNYVSPALALGDGFGAVGWRWDVNPSTSAQWTAAGYNAIELGMESAA